jgi:5-(carboxyamino)imidazole ribonucleotide synthase
LHHLFARMPDARVHLYGKEERPGRKVGHVNFVGADLDKLRERAELAAHWLSHAQWRAGDDAERSDVGAPPACGGEEQR